MHSIVDVLGFFSHRRLGADGSLYTPVTPTRTTDTRRNGRSVLPRDVCTAVGPSLANTEISTVAASPVDAVATIANVTVVQPTTTGGTSPPTDCGILVPGHQTHSNSNFTTDGDVVANLTLSPSEGNDRRRTVLHLLAVVTA